MLYLCLVVFHATYNILLYKRYTLVICCTYVLSHYQPLYSRPGSCTAFVALNIKADVLVL